MYDTGMIDPELETQIITCVKTLLLTDSDQGYIEFTELELKKHITSKKKFGPRDIHNIFNSHGMKYYCYNGLYRLANFGFIYQR